MERHLRALTEAFGALHPHGSLVVVTGAGISLASGIPTFRGTDPGAVWKHDLLEMATFQFFRRDPVESWRWYLHRFRKIFTARPNPAHFAVAALERWHQSRGGHFLLVTQNIDTLHELAGSRAMVKVHGTSDRVRCPQEGCVHGAPRGSLPRDDHVDIAALAGEPSFDTLPRCPACGDILRPHLLWFDEFYTEHDDYEWYRVQDAATNMGLLLFIGTSFSVGVTDLFAQHGLFGRVPMLSIDPGGERPPYSGLTVVTAKAEELLPALCAQLGAELDVTDVPAEERP